MLRTTLAPITVVAALASHASADPKSALDAAIAAAEAGRCDDALELTRAIGDADRAFYAANVPTQPALAACIRTRVKEVQSTPLPRVLEPERDEGTGKSGQILLATGAGTLAFLGTAYLMAQLICEHSCLFDEGKKSTVLLAGSAGLAIASTATVYLSGHDSAHDDSIAMTATGAVGLGLIGTAVGMPMLDDENALLGAAIIVGSSAVGATIGFHLGRSTKRDLEIVPAAGSGFTGAILGGSF
jgi:hypothetical protein